MPVSLLTTLFDYGGHGALSNVRFRQRSSQRTHSPMLWKSVLAALGSSAVFVVYELYKRSKRISIGNVPGPDSDSFWLGKMVFA